MCKPTYMSNLPPVNPKLQAVDETLGDDVYRHIFEHSAIGMAIVAPDGRWVEVNPALCRLLGYSRQSLLSHDFREFTHPEDLARNEVQIRRMLSGEREIHGLEKRYFHANGREVWVRMDVALVRRPDGSPDYFITQVRDITEQVRIQRALEANQTWLDSIIASMADGMVVQNADGRIQACNRRAEVILGAGAEELRRRGPDDERWQAVREDGTGLPGREHAAIVALKEGRSVRDQIMGMAGPDGQRIWLSVNSEPLRYDDGQPLQGVVTTFLDVTARIEAEQALKDREERLALALAGANLGMWDWDLSSGEFLFNRSAMELLGYRRGDVDEHIEAVRDLFHPDDIRVARAAMREHLGGSAMFESVARMRRKSGGYIWALIRGRITERDDNHRGVRACGTLMDITEWKQLESRLKEMAATDALTGIANRRYGLQRLEDMLNGRRGRDGQVSLLLFDIDHFKRINDTLGHDAGDEVLKQVSQAIRGAVRHEDLLVRWGGEEFAVLLPNTNLAGAKVLAGNLLETLRGLEISETGPVTASFGVVAAAAGEKSPSLLARADELMYRAKSEGRDRAVSQDEVGTGR